MRKKRRSIQSYELCNSISKHHAGVSINTNKFREDMAIKVGDKISIEIKKSDNRQREIESYHINEQDVERILPFWYFLVVLF